MTTINRAPFNALVDDDGSNLVGTVWGKPQIKSVLLDPIDVALATLDAKSAAWAEFSTAAVGAQNNLAFADADLIRATNATALTLTGLLAPATAMPGKQLIVLALGAGSVTFNNADAASAAANQIITNTGAPLKLLTGGWAILVRDNTSSRWRVTAASGLQVTTSISNSDVGALNDWAPAGFGARDTHINWFGGSSTVVSGFAGGVAGQRITITNTFTTIMTFAHNSASSAVGNRLHLPVTVGNLPIAGGGSAEFIYIGSLWVLSQHEQGAWITPPYNAADYSASSGVWGVDAADVVTFQYRVSGKSLSVNFYIVGTDVSAAAVYLARTIPGGFKNAGARVIAPALLGDVGAGTLGYVDVNPALASGTQMTWTKLSGNWTITAADNTYIMGTVSFEIQ